MQLCMVSKDEYSEYIMQAWRKNHETSGLEFSIFFLGFTLVTMSVMSMLPVFRKLSEFRKIHMKREFQNMLDLGGMSQS